MILGIKINLSYFPNQISSTTFISLFLTRLNKMISLINWHWQIKINRWYSEHLKHDNKSSKAFIRTTKKKHRNLFIVHGIVLFKKRLCYVILLYLLRWFCILLSFQYFDGWYFQKQLIKPEARTVAVTQTIFQCWNILLKDITYKWEKTPKFPKHYYYLSSIHKECFGMLACLW